MEWIFCVAAGFLVAFVAPGAVRAAALLAAVGAGLYLLGPVGTVATAVWAAVIYRFGR